MAQETIKKLMWFVGLWLAGVVAVGLVAEVIRLMLGLH